jgi:uncharacterized membrane protein YfcA
MTIVNMIVLFIAAMLGGALNSVAGGGSFISFPALIFTGVPPIAANATNTVALWPGSVASTWAYRKELGSVDRLVLVVFSVTSLVGGILGALLLLHTSQSTFVRLIPYLLLVATLLFTFSPRVTTFIRKQTGRKPEGIQEDEMEVAKDEAEIEKNRVVLGDRAEAELRTPINRMAVRPGMAALIGISILQLVISIYGGYFGGGMGILMLAVLGILGMENIHEMNALKTLLTSFVNGVAVVTFAIAGAVVWPQAILMVIGAILGGYGGAYYARQLDPRVVRIFVMLVGFGMTIYFFVRP